MLLWETFFSLDTANKKKAEQRKTGGGPPPPPFTPAEEKAIAVNKGRPMMDGIAGGTVSSAPRHVPGEVPVVLPVTVLGKNMKIFGF